MDNKNNINILNNNVIKKTLVLIRKLRKAFWKHKIKSLKHIVIFISKRNDIKFKFIF